MSKLEITPGLAYAMATDHAYGTAIAPRKWDSTDDREDALWERFSELLGHPSEERLREVMWEHREDIWSVMAHRVAHTMRLIDLDRRKSASR